MTIVGEAVAPIIMGYGGYYGEYGDCLSHTAGMLWGDWRVCVIETPRSSLNKISCTRQFESKLSLRSFAKSLDKRRIQAFCPWRVGNYNSKPGVPKG